MTMYKMELNEVQNLKKEFEDIYTPIEEAKKEIWRRWNDKKLRKEVDKFLKNDVPDFLKNSPRAILARFILSPNFELFHFLELSKIVNLEPLCLEYSKDKFVAENIDKYYLCKLFFHNGIGKNGGNNISALKIVDLGHAEGKNICELTTIYKDNLTNFHHNLIHSLNLESDIDSFDISEYYKRNGGVANKYYIYFLSLFICYGILFENYLFDKIQINITKNVVLPSYKKIYKMFGLKPLIVHLGPAGDEENLYWRYYSRLVRNKIDNLYKNIE